MSGQKPEDSAEDGVSDSESNEVVLSELDPILESIPPEHRGAVFQIIEQTIAHSGPLPSPRQLQEYDAVLPGLAERIVRLTETEQEHRHEIVKTGMSRIVRLKERGQAMGMIALVLMLAFCAYLAALGFGATAGGVAVGLIAAVVGIFVIGRAADRAEEQDHNIEA